MTCESASVIVIAEVWFHDLSGRTSSQRGYNLNDWAVHFRFLVSDRLNVLFFVWTDQHSSKSGWNRWQSTLVAKAVYRKGFKNP